MLKKLLVAFGLALGAIGFGVAATMPPLSSGAPSGATAGGSWTTSSTSIALNGACPSGLIAGMNVTDTTVGATSVVGSVASCFGSTLYLQAAPAFASSGSTDKLTFAGAGPQWNEPGQMMATLNYVIAQLNSVMAGQFVSIPAPITTSGTGANTIFNYTNLVINPGQAVRIKAWGVNDSNADARTVTVNYGTGPTQLATVVTGTSAKWWVECLVANEGTVASPSIQLLCTGAQAATLITTGIAADTTAGDATFPQTLLLTATAATAGAMTIDGAWAEYVR